MKKQSIQSLFKPFKIEKKRFVDFLDSKTKRNFYKHRFWFECSKAADESCINTECQHNYLKMHDSELYKELKQEIQAEKLEIKNRNGMHGGDGVCNNN